MHAVLPDSDSFGYEVATLALGIVTAEFLVHSRLLTPVARSSWLPSCTAARWSTLRIALRA